MGKGDTLIHELRAGLAKVANAEKASEMRKYMKSEMPYRGVPKPERSQLAREIFNLNPLPDRDTWTATILKLWREADFREERYLAVDLSGYKPYLKWQSSELLPLYEEMIVTGAWWDYVDELAIRRVGPLLRSETGAIKPMMQRWAKDNDNWRQRTAVICQVGSNEETDTDLLAETIKSTMDNKDFFLRKGIGWALREYSKTNPPWVKDFVASHPTLSPLSRREALRLIQ